MNIAEATGGNGSNGGLRSSVGLLSEDDLANILDVGIATLQSWRAGKTGPDYVKAGKKVFYRRADVEEWIAANVVVTNRTAQR